jgi:hypothetical protein
MLISAIAVSDPVNYRIAKITAQELQCIANNGCENCQCAGSLQASAGQ